METTLNQPTDEVQPVLKRTARDYGVLGLKGFAMGSADVVPGVSGGTMAFILGIYEELINSIRMVGQPEFVCGRDSITDVDGNKYPTVQIGGQCWTAENLRTLHLPEDPAREIEGRFCLNLNCTNAFGAHYSWEAMMNGAGSVTAEDEVQGICPCEWHLPTKEEWEALNSYLSVDGNGGAGVNVPNKMRGADSPSGFDALYAGNWGYSVFEGENAVFWTATEQAGGRAFYRLINNFPLLGQGHLEKRSGLSVRCVRNRQ